MIFTGTCNSTAKANKRRHVLPGRLYIGAHERCYRASWVGFYCGLHGLLAIATKDRLRLDAFCTEWACAFALRPGEDDGRRRLGGGLVSSAENKEKCANHAENRENKQEILFVIH